MTDPYHEWADRELLDEHEAHPQRFARYVVQPTKTMNTKPNDGGSILPAMQSNCGGHGIAPRCDGLSIRDYFAAAALQGEMANPASGLFEADSVTFDDVASDCYRIADAMLAARES